jgi:C1A family cysteine protease
MTHHYEEKYTITGWNSVESFNETRLVEVLANVGPISVALDASSKEFRFYKNGVMDTCGIQLNHAVLLVGYGTEDGQDYFKIKNSWGETYGDEGYIKISRNKHYMGTCGVASIPVYPLV